MEFKKGVIVRHKLTGEKFILLDETGKGVSQSPTRTVRNKKMERIELQECEIEITKK